MQKLHFENQFLHAFPEIATRVPTTPVQKPEILIWSDEAAATLGLSHPMDPNGIEAQVFSGNQLLDGMEPYATRYGGHQFGHWAGQLGDGRAIALGEALTHQGRIEIQLKGAGVTPYSRRGDGRAVLRSSLREFLCSEAMFHLGIPTTRALCCVLTGDQVMRDMFYDGNPRPEPGAITTRLAPSFVRFGHFQILAADKNSTLTAKLVDETIKNYFPEVQGDRARWFAEVCRRTADLMVHWQRVGFVHGVMNTDNLSVLGLTIDYGPYGWMDIYDPDWTPNTTDEENRRYRFGQQPAIALWNLQKLAEALSHLTPEDTEWLRSGLELYAQVYNDGVVVMMGQKLGIVNPSVELISELDRLMRTTEVDMTIFYRQLSKVRAGESFEALMPAFYQKELAADLRREFETWIERYRTLVKLDARPTVEVIQQMDQINPYFILRNYLAQEALDALEKNDRSIMNRLMVALKTPYEENEFTRDFYKRMPDWARNRAGCSALSCSS